MKKYIYLLLNLIVTFAFLLVACNSNAALTPVASPLAETPLPLANTPTPFPSIDSTARPIATQTQIIKTASTSTATSSPLTMLAESDGATLIFVPSGKFLMGRGDGTSDEKPVHTVYLEAFWIDQTEVTNAMFAEFLNQQGNQTEGGVAWLDTSESDVRIHLDSNKWKADSGYGKHPVVEVSWYGANAYCTWANRRLPTEAEWEKAARGGLEKKSFPWGEKLPVCDKEANNGAQYSSCDGHLVPVASYGANGYGLYDMAGNVWEWVADWYDAYPGNTTNNNYYGTTHRVLRGGSWTSLLDLIRSDNRNRSEPANTESDIGFRCSRSQ